MALTLQTNLMIFARNLVLAATLVLFLLPASATAQFAITGASISDGEANVPLVDSVYFAFNQLLPFNTLFTQRFFWEPRGHYQRTEVFLNVDRMNPRFRLVHEQNYDFSVYVFGVASDNGNRMQRPFTLNYSTAATTGSRQVAGTVSFSTRTASSAPSLASLIYDHYADGMVEPVQMSAAKTTAGESGGLSIPEFLGKHSTEVRKRSRTDSPVLSKRSSQPNNLNYTVILLLDQFAIDSATWTVRAVAAISPTGTYSFDHVRDGTYYPVAFNYTDDTGEAIGHYGYYDSDGDFSPDPIAVSGGNLSEIDINLYSYGSTQALTDRALAESEAQSISPDAVLVNVSGTTSLDGTATTWTYLFRSDALAKDITVEVDPLTVTSTVHASSFLSPTTLLPQPGLIDSGSAVAVADNNGGSDFRAANPGNYSIQIKGGNQLGELPQEPTQLIWRVRYSAGGSPDPPFVIYIDMMSGDPIDDLPVELTELMARVDNSDVTLAWSTASETNNVGFDIERSLVEFDDWSSVGFVPAATAHTGPLSYSYTVRDMKPGQYRFRLRQIDIDGSSHYSQSIEVNVVTNALLSLGSVFPNPANRSATIELVAAEGGPVTVLLFDVLGRETKRLFEGEIVGSQILEIQLDTDELNNGTYFIEAKLGITRSVQSFIVSR